MKKEIVVVAIMINVIFRLIEMLLVSNILNLFKFLPFCWNSIFHRLNLLYLTAHGENFFRLKPGRLP